MKLSFKTQQKLPDLMKWIIIYLTITVLLYFFGPIDWKTKNTILVVVYLALYEAALLFGYKFGLRRYYDGAEEVHSSEEFTFHDHILIRRLLLLGIIFDILMMIRMANSLSPFVIIQNIINGITSPASQYSTYYQNAAAGNLWGGGIFSLFITLGTPFAVAGIILSIFYYKQLNTELKILTWVQLIVHIGGRFISSANEGLFDTAIYIAVALMVRYINSNIVNPNRTRMNKKRKIGLVLLISILVIAIMVFFTNNIMGRTLGNFAFGTLGENKYNENSPILRYIPRPLMVTIVYLSAYLCEGYYGFSLTTMVDWTPMFGLGFSSFLRNNVSELLGVDLLQYTYQKKVESISTWGALKNFHSAYTFWACDVSHIGVIIVMFIIGYKFAVYYRRSVMQCSKTAIVMMPLLITLMFYLPANNKIFAQPSSFLLILFIVLYDRFGKKRVQS